MKKDSVRFGASTIKYGIVFSSRRKTASLSVYPLKEVEIRVPESLRKSEIRELVRKKAPWIARQMKWFDQIIRAESPKEHVNGESYLHLGRQHRLKIARNGEKPKAETEGRYLRVSVPKRASEEREKNIVKAAIWKWYREEAAEKIGEAVEAFSIRLGIPKPRFRVKDQSKRWGSCSGNSLNFNFRIVMAPAALMQYVVAHEMCHLKHGNHSSGFWKELRTVMPDFEERKERLRREGGQYAL